MIYIRVDFLPNQKTLIHEKAFGDAIFKVFLTDHPYNTNRVRIDGSDKVHDGPKGVWRTFYMTEEVNLAESLPQILLPIVLSEDDLFTDLVKNEFYMEVTYFDQNFEQISYNHVSPQTVHMITGLKAANHQLTTIGVSSELRDHNSKLIIGDVNVYDGPAQ